jgi:hypothetical protein
MQVFRFFDADSMRVGCRIGERMRSSIIYRAENLEFIKQFLSTSSTTLHDGFNLSMRWVTGL